MRTLLVQCWRDPKYRLYHEVWSLEGRLKFQNLVKYETSCGLHLGPDDINVATMSFNEPTCIACLCADDRHAVVNEQG